MMGEMVRAAALRDCHCCHSFSGLRRDETPEEKAIKNRLHIDVSPTDRTRDEEVDRLLALGAKHADIGQGDVEWVVLRDPEDNEFCVLGSQVEGDVSKWPWPGMG